MKLFNTVIVFDIYTCAESAEAARECAEAAIREGLPPSESIAPEVKRESEVREAWRAQGPLVAADVSDADFEKVKGTTTLDVFKMLHTKQPANDTTAPKPNGKSKTQPATAKP